MSDSAQCPLLSSILQSPTQERGGLSVSPLYNLSKKQLEVSGNINMDQQLGCGIRNTLDNQLSGSHCIKLSSFPICGISTLDHGHTIFPPLPDGLWPELPYSVDSKAVKPKLDCDKWCTFLRAVYVRMCGHLPLGCQKYNCTVRKWQRLGLESHDLNLSQRFNDFGHVLINSCNSIWILKQH